MLVGKDVKTCHEVTYVSIFHSEFCAPNLRYYSIKAFQIKLLYLFLWFRGKVTVIIYTLIFQ